MPELPEVETIKSDLEKFIPGQKIVRVKIYNPKVIRQPTPAVFQKNLCGARITAIMRRGKLLILELSGKKFLTVHFKMTGQLVLRDGDVVGVKLGDVAPKSATRVTFYLRSGKELDFNDQRLFGELRLVDDWKKLKFIQKLGREPFDIGTADFKKMLAGRKTKIKPLLMDQGFIAGIGNIYASEILFRSGINPQRPANDLSAREQEALHREMIKVLKSAIKHGGSSVDDYVRLSGKNGDYARFHRVYGRSGKACYICATQIKRIAQGGRGTFFCSKCQPAGNKE